ncbi:MAG: hypothetical protein KAR39_12330 [Thermoplasmata archaeon]|nr:hypothetical protein [Thermoplasmata archaeon]
MPLKIGNAISLMNCRRGITRPASPFSPTDLDDREVWFMGEGFEVYVATDKLVPAENDGDLVGWLENDGDLYTCVIQGNATYKPEIKFGGNGINGLPVIRDVGNKILYADEVGDINQPCTIYGVFKPHSFGVSMRLVADASPNEYGVKAYLSEYCLYFGTYACCVAIPNNVPTIYTAIVNGASSSVQINDGTPVTGNPGAGYFNGFRLGGGINSDVDFAEVIICSSVHSAALQEKVRDYLNGRFAVY